MTAIHESSVTRPLDGVMPLERLPLVTLYLSERCNSRCITCDYWRHGTADMNLAAVRGLLPHLARLRTESVLISGGEPLLNREWPLIVELLRQQGLKLWLLTSGLSLAKHAQRVAAMFDAVTVSLDGTNRETYQAIRGVDAFDNVCAGIRAVAQLGARVSVRVTLQRANYRELPRFVDIARECGAAEVSFLAVDVANPHAFGRQDEYTRDLALRVTDLSVLEDLVHAMERSHAEEFRRGFIAQSPQKLLRIHQYFSAVLGQGSYPPVLCNAPEFSVVINARGRLSPCFFIDGPPAALEDDLSLALNSGPMMRLRADIRAAARHECTHCVCSMWRDPESLSVAGLFGGGSDHG